MKKIIINLAALLMYCVSLSAQDIQWEKDPSLHTVPDEYKKESAVIIYDARYIDFKTVGEDVMGYRSMHRIVRVQDDKGVETFNKAYVPAGPLDVESIQARTIVKGNKVFEVSKDKIKKVKSESGRDMYLIAFEGVEKGAEVELLYTEKKAFSIFGGEDFQYNFPILNASFNMSSPKRYRFETKGYNGFPGTKDTLVNGRYLYSAQASVKAMKEEAYCNSDALGANLSYRMSFLMDESPDVRMFTWRDLTKKIYTRYYTFSDKEKRVTEKFLESIGVKEGDSENDKIKKIEDAIKTTINVNKDLDDEAYNKIDKTLNDKTSTEAGVVRLYCCCLTLANVKHELGVTSDRYKSVIDEDFENWNSLDEYVIYFPKEDKYMAPISIYFRCPMIPTSYIGNKGIFCRTTTAGNITSALPDIRDISYLPADSSHNDILATISFKTDELEPQIDLTALFSGYSAFGIREIANFVTKDKEKDFVQEMMHIVDKPEHMLSYKITDAAFQNYYTNTPLKFNAQLKAPQLIEKAGNKYLFKIGEVIGNQQEMYQTEKRERTINLPFPHSLYRTITLEIPVGYKILNAETLNINAEHKDSEGKETMAFHSGYKIAGGKLHIDIKEFYNELNYDVSVYDVFTKVINAAADFNKVVLVLEKE